MIELKNVYKSYKTGSIKRKVLNDIDLTIKEKEIIIILGASGSGKTTLLNCISGLDKIDSRKNSYIKFEGKDISKYSDFKMTKFRKKNLGFIFQTYNLLEHLNVRENILVGAKLGKRKIDMNELLDVVGLRKHKNKYMSELSGGEQQRVSIARALAKNPKVMFCDEPTGALDEKTGKKVLKLLQNLNQKYHTTIIIVTHNPSIALMANTVITMNSGKIIKVQKNKTMLDAEELRWA